jgi:two-component system, OmpR family, response regulator
MLKALVVEDDLELAGLIKAALEKKGLKVKVLHCLKPALELIEQETFSLAIVDRVLPDGDGLELVEELMIFNYQTRVLILSTRHGVNDRIKGLKLGADEYLSKPFSHQELMLRIESLLSKQKIYTPEVISCGEIVLFPKTCILVTATKRSKLRPKEAKVLACLIYHQGLTVTDDVLLDFVWGDTGNLPSHESISVYIRRIRMALGSAADKLQTRRGIGYCLS